MRAYGEGTSLMIDRESQMVTLPLSCEILIVCLTEETKSHKLLAERGLAPPLLARFNNGLLYKYIRGRVCSPEDLTREAVWRGVARRLAEWHAIVPPDQIR